MFFYFLVRNNTSVLRAYSSYFEIITPSLTAEQIYIENDLSVVLNIVIQVLAILIGIVLIVLLTLCFVYRFNAKNAGGGEEVISLRDSLRFVK